MGRKCANSGSLDAAEWMGAPASTGALKRRFMRKEEAMDELGFDRVNSISGTSGATCAVGGGRVGH